MALSIPSAGSGEFVPVRVWSCPEHDGPQYDDHECDCDCCAYTPPPECPTCEAGTWVDKIGEDGNVVMRELGQWEALLHKMPAPTFPEPLLAKMLTASNAKFTWVEDALIPTITSPHSS